MKSENRGIETSRHPGPGRATSRAGTISSKETGNRNQGSEKGGQAGGVEWSGVGLRQVKHDRWALNSEQGPENTKKKKKR